MTPTLRTDRAGRTPMERIEAHIARDWLGTWKQYELPLMGERA